MKKTDIYEIVLKIFGLWMVYITISIIPSLLWVFESIEIQVILYSLFGPILSILFTYFLLFKTKSLVNVISQEEDNNEIYNLSIHSLSLYYLACIILGLFLIINTIPSMVDDIISWWQMNKYSNYAGYIPQSRAFTIHAIELAIGLILIVSHKRIAPFIQKLGKKNINENDEIL